MEVVLFVQKLSIPHKCIVLGLYQTIEQAAAKCPLENPGFANASTLSGANLKLSFSKCWGC